jgi:hypothetical protein
MRIRDRKILIQDQGWKKFGSGMEKFESATLFLIYLKRGNSGAFSGALVAVSLPHDGRLKLRGTNR